MAEMDKARRVRRRHGFLPSAMHEHSQEQSNHHLPMSYGPGDGGNERRIDGEFENLTAIHLLASFVDPGGLRCSPIYLHPVRTCVADWLWRCLDLSWFGHGLVFPAVRHTPEVI
jgi:hypothetical protein